MSLNISLKCSSISTSVDIFEDLVKCSSISTSVDVFEDEDEYLENLIFEDLETPAKNRFFNIHIPLLFQLPKLLI